MHKLNPFKEKYWDFYMNIALLAATQSVAEKQKVGAVIVTPEGMLSTGWNGTPPGIDNTCEEGGETLPHVIHAEANAIYKMLKTGVPTQGSVLFTTHSPCMECAKLIYSSGIMRIIYAKQHTNIAGLVFLARHNTNISMYGEHL